VNLCESTKKFDAQLTAHAQLRSVGVDGAAAFQEVEHSRLRVKENNVLPEGRHMDYVACVKVGTISSTVCIMLTVLLCPRLIHHPLFFLRQLQCIPDDRDARRTGWKPCPLAFTPINQCAKNARQKS
jgi:hypothetical protein